MDKNNDNNNGNFTRAAQHRPDVPSMETIECPFCEEAIRLDNTQTTVHVTLSRHINQLCSRAQDEAEWIKQTFLGMYPRNGQRKPLVALNLRVVLPRDSLAAFRACRYKMVKNNHVLPPRAFRAQPMRSHGILEVVCILSFQGHLVSDAPRVTNRMARKLKELKLKHHHLLETKFERGNPVQSSADAFSVTVSFALDKESVPFRKLNCLRKEATHPVRCHPHLATYQNKELLELAVDGIQALDLKQSLLATDCVLVKYRLVRNEDSLVSYQITVPLASTAKALRILQETWRTGGSFIEAKSAEVDIKVPVTRAWLSNPNFFECTMWDTALANIIRWIGSVIAGKSSMAKIISQIVGVYWSCDFVAAPLIEHCINVKCKEQWM
mmetsp:Transcript_10560/g.20394  ORF Transcript_10560/g.20394 Transcript_10560/m.20394 type:complete len:382 (-) Transcript_10560:303-1448(-)